MSCSRIEKWMLPYVDGFPGLGIQGGVPIQQWGEDRMKNRLQWLRRWSAYYQACSPDGRLDHAVDRVTIERAVAKLPDGYRLVFVLHDVEGYEHHEIAELLGCSIGNTKSQLHKARVKIRQYLREGVNRQRRRRVAA